MNQSLKPVHIINVPLDLGASKRGTDAGPSAFQIAGLKPSIEELGYDTYHETDIVIPHIEHCVAEKSKTRFKQTILSVCQDLANTTYRSISQDQFPLVIGGDHSIAMGTISGLAAHYQKQQQDLGVIWFDAHGDMNTPESSPSGNIHGMPLAHLLGYGDKDLSSILDVNPALKPENVVLVGVRDIDKVERDFINKSGVKVFTMRDIDELGMCEVARRSIEIVTKNTAGFHLSFDLDGCDPEVIPGSGTLVPGGVNYREAHLLLEECASSRQLRSMEVVELNPFLDHANLSAKRAVTFIQSALGRNIL